MAMAVEAEEEGEEGAGMVVVEATAEEDLTRGTNKVRRSKVPAC